MSHSLMVASLIFILLAGGSRSIPPQTAPLSIPNGGFETFPAGGPNDWTWPSSDWVWDGSVAHGGTHSVRVQRSSGAETASLWSAYVSVQPSTVYTLSYWLRTSDSMSYPSISIYQYTFSINIVWISSSQCVMRYCIL